MSRPFCFAMLLEIAAAASIAGGAVVCSGCSAGHAGATAGPAGPPAADLTVRRGRFTSRFLMTGQLEAASADSLVVPRIPTWQTTIRWLEAEGKEVKAGQKIVEFDTAAFAADYGEKVLSRDQAQSDLEQADADAAGQRADKEFQVAQKTIAVEKAGIAAAIPAEFLRGKEWQDDQLALERAKTDLAKAREDAAAQESTAAETIRQKRIALEKAEREYEAARQALDGMVLKAPRDGILVVGDHPWEGRKLQVGDSVWVGLPVASLPDLHTMRVVAKLSDVDDGRIVPGLPVTCTLDAYPDREYAGRVGEIMPVAQEDGRRSLRRVYSVRVDLESSDAARMRPGMSVKVEVLGPERDGVLLAPRAGLDLAGTAPRARLASGRTVDVTLGPCNDDVCLVEDGLSEGERLKAAG
jgi:multidrug resistance efflux pump